MASGRSFSRGSGRRSVPKGRDWVLGPGHGTWTNVSANQTTIIGNGLAATIADLTILRVRGEFLAYMSTAGGANEDIRGALGIAVVSDDSFSVGASAMPEPLNDPGYPWLYHRIFHLSSAVAAIGTASTGDNIQSVRFEIDSKAMRRISPDQVLAMILETTDEQGTVTIRVAGATRMLAQWAGG